MAENVKNLLLVLTSSATSDKALDFAIETAKKEGAKLVALYLIETELAEEVFDKFSDIGFIGERPSMELTEAVMKDYRQRGYEELGHVQIKAMEEDLPYDLIMEQGAYLESVLEVITERGVETAVVSRSSVADELSKSAPCKVHIFEE
jgi:nucleotide-binding universal stress UspA family protein